VIEMAEKSLADKLLLKPGRTVRVMDAPQGYADLLFPLPAGVRQASISNNKHICMSQAGNRIRYF
jgi:hypothetical protein